MSAPKQPPTLVAELLRRLAADLGHDAIIVVGLDEPADGEIGTRLFAYAEQDASPRLLQATYNATLETARALTGKTPDIDVADPGRGPQGSN